LICQKDYNLTSFVDILPQWVNQFLYIFKSAKNEEQEIYEQILIVEKKSKRPTVQGYHFREPRSPRDPSPECGRVRDQLMSLMEAEDATCHRLANDQGRHRGLVGGPPMLQLCQWYVTGLFASYFSFAQIQVATFVNQRILSDTEGLNFMRTAERFVKTSRVLRSMVVAQPASRVACDAWKGILPNSLLDGTFNTFLSDDHTIRGWLHQLLINLQGTLHATVHLQRIRIGAIETNIGIAIKRETGIRIMAWRRGMVNAEIEIRKRDRGRGTGRERDRVRGRRKHSREKRTKNEQDREKSHYRKGKDIDREKSHEREVKDKYKVRSCDREDKERVRKKSQDREVKERAKKKSHDKEVKDRGGERSRDR
nr:cell differentiation protein RCD1 homolog isoform X1 [Tanacetum cinerariifolium]